jgi:hypothetical protein
VRELKNRYYKLESYIKDAQDKAEIQIEEQQSGGGQSGGGVYNPDNPDDPLGILGP